MPQPSAPPPERIGRYRIDRKIGEGGMGVVYAAHDERLDRPVALKMIRGDGDDTARKRMWREARAVAGVSHPHICQLYEIEESDDGLFMAMELLEGEPLASRLKQGAMVPPAASTIGLETLEALEALHARGFVHRDLKPSNIFLTPHGVKLLDFGLARPVSAWTNTDTATQLTMAEPSPDAQYMAPACPRGTSTRDAFRAVGLSSRCCRYSRVWRGPGRCAHAVLHEHGALWVGEGRSNERVIRRGSPEGRHRYATPPPFAELRAASGPSFRETPAPRPDNARSCAPFRSAPRVETTSCVTCPCDTTSCRGKESFWARAPPRRVRSCRRPSSLAADADVVSP